MGSVYNNLGNIHQELGSYNQSQICYERASVIYSNNLDRAHPDIQDVRINLAILERRRGHYSEAIRHLNECLHAKVVSLGSKHSDVANG